MLAGTWSENGQVTPCFRSPAKWRIRTLLALNTSPCTLCSLRDRRVAVVCRQRLDAGVPRLRARH